MKDLAEDLKIANDNLYCANKMLEKEIERLNKGYCKFKEECGKYATCLRENQLKEIERLNNIINELEKCIKDKYYEAIDYQTKIRQSDLMQGNYPVGYYLEEQNEQLCNYFLNRLKDLQELKESDKE